MLTPGLHRNVAEMVYREYDALNASIVKHGIGRGSSLRAMKHAIDNPTEPTAAMDLGTLLHAKILEPETFLDRLAIWEGGVRRGKAYDEFEAANAGRIIIKPDEAATIARMADAVMDNRRARVLFNAAGERECVAIWNTRLGFQCKARIDYLNTDEMILVDLKTCRSADDGAWARAAEDLKYDVQAAWYRWGFEHVTGKPCKVAFVAVENEGLHRCRVFMIPPDVLAVCDEAFANLLPMWGEARKSGAYPDIEFNDPTEVIWPAWSNRTVYKEPTDDDVPF